jgi:DNA polymerase III subunit delta'
MQFKEVIGHEDIKKRLLQTVKDNRISHAQLFVGPEGSGSLALAIAYAQYISCSSRIDGDSCGICASCQKYQKLIHPDLHFVFPITSTKNNAICDELLKEWRAAVTLNPYLSINQWYEAIGVENKQGIIGKNESGEILRKINLKAFEADYKIMIIWMPEKMNATSANKLLKILEEPPPKTLFILVAENVGQIIPTILSRTQLVKIPKIDDKNLLDALILKFGLTVQVAKNVVQLSQGSFVNAMQLVQADDDNSFNFIKFQELMRMTYSRKFLDLFGWVDEMSEVGREKQKIFLTYSQRLLRENLLLNLGKSELTHLTDKESEFSGKFNPFINLNNVYQISDELNKAQTDIEWNGYGKIIFLDLALKITKLIRN